MRNIRGIIFDCDGVLFASHEANLAYYNEVLARLGEPPVLPEDRVKAHLCHTAASPRVFDILLGPHRVEEALDLASTLDFRQFISKMVPEPEMEVSLGTLASKMPLAVATNRGNSMAEILKHFGLTTYFRTVVTSRDVLLPKPHPDMLLLAAERLGLARGELLFVGDSDLDRQAAKEAGILFAAYKGGVKGDIEISTYRELVQLFESGGET